MRTKRPSVLAALLFSFATTLAVVEAQVAHASQCTMPCIDFQPGLGISGDGRYVAFPSSATNLVPGDTNGHVDVYVRDRASATTLRVSIASNGDQANGASSTPAMSNDGRWVVFASAASNLVAGDQNDNGDVFLRDLQLNTTVRVSSPSVGEADGDSYDPTISADGRYMAFVSSATNLVPGDSNGKSDVFLFDRTTGILARASLGASGQEPNADSSAPRIGGGSEPVVGFTNAATNMGWTTLYDTVYVRDIAAGVTTAVSLGPGGTASDGPSYIGSVSPDGRYVVYSSFAHNVGPDSNWGDDVFRFDRVTGTTITISVNSDEQQGQNVSSVTPNFGSNGNSIAFVSTDDGLANHGTTSTWQIFRRDVAVGATYAVSTTPGGSFASQMSARPVFSAGGAFIVFGSCAPDLVAYDTNDSSDVFIVDLGSSAISRVSVSSSGQQGNGTSSSGDVGPLGGCGGGTPPIIVPQSLTPQDFGNTIFASQSLSARIVGAVNPSSIVFALLDETSGSIRTISGPAVTYDSQSGWATTTTQSLASGHLYRIMVEARDFHGNANRFAQAEVADNGGFLATSVTLRGSTASIPSTACQVSGTVDGAGLRTVTCPNVPLAFASTTVDLAGVRARPSTGFVEETTPLSTAILRSTVAGLPATVPAYSQSDPAWGPKTASLRFDVPATGGLSGLTVAGVTKNLGTLVTKAPSTWTSAALEMAGVPTTASTSACATPSALNGIRCDPDILRNGYIVRLNAGGSTAAATAATLSTMYGLEITHTYETIFRGFSMIAPYAAATTLALDPGVNFIVREEVGRVFAQTTSTGLTRIGGGDGVGSTGHGVTVAVLDTGVDLTHPDLQASVVGTADCTASISGAQDNNGHGTHVAGIIAARDNNEGVLGVAPGAGIWAIKTTFDVGPLSGMHTTANLLCGLEIVALHSPARTTTDVIRVVNMSFGHPGRDDGACGVTDVDPVHLAVCQLVSEGILFVAAAGNSGAGFDVIAPAAYSEVLAVTNLLDIDGAPCGIGSEVDDTANQSSNFPARASDVPHTIMAPGSFIYSTWKAGGYHTRSGTSMSAAFVSGSAALVLASSPTSTPALVQSHLLSIAEPPDINFNGECTGGTSHRDAYPGRPHPEPVLRVGTL